MILIRQIKEQFPEHRGLYILGAVYFVAALALQQSVGFPLMWRSPATFMVYGGYMLAIAIMSAAIVKTVLIMLSGKPEQPTRQVLEWAKRLLLEKPRLANGIHATVLFTIFYGIFGAIKSAIPFIAPFSWDPIFYEMDKLLFGGGTAWEAWSLKALPETVYIVLNFFYNLWLLVVICFMVFFGFSKSSRLRTVFFTSGMFTWAVCGNVLAILFSSAGPCFYGLLLPGVDPYAEHVAHLQQLHAKTGMVFAVFAQEILWQNYSHLNDGAVSGISAMPSLHVAFSILMALAAWRLNKAFGIVMIVFAVLICFGSVILAWHYAVDGVLGGVGAAVIWYAVRSYYQARAELVPNVAEGEAL